MKVFVPHQLEHLPYLGLFQKFARADAIVLCDDFQFKKDYFENRNKIRTSSEQGWQWVTIPVESDTHKPLNQIKVNYSRPWTKKYLESIKQAYSKSFYFSTYYPQIEEIINSNYPLLWQINDALLRMLLKGFKINAPILYSSQYNLNPEAMKSDKVLELMKAVGASTFIGGVSAREYIHEESFAAAGIKVEYQEVFHPVYKQRYEPFLQGMSALDLLMNYGDMASDILNCKGGATLRYILDEIPNWTSKKALELFCGDGSGHMAWYGYDIKGLTGIELDQAKANKCQEDYPNAHIICGNSLRHMCETSIKYELVIVDTPALMKQDFIQNNIHKLVEKEADLIFRAIKQPYGNDSRVSKDLPIEEFANTLTNLEVLYMKEHTREYYFLNHWISYYKFSVRRT